MARYLKAPLIASRRCLKDIDRLKEHPDILANCSYMVGRYIGAEKIKHSVALKHITESVQVFCDSSDLPMFQAIILQNLKAGAKNPATNTMVCYMEDEDDIMADSEADA